MKKQLLLVLLLILSCNKAKKTVHIIETIELEQIKFKLSKSEFTLLKFKTDWHWVYQNVESAQLSQSELIDVESILEIAIKESNLLQKRELNAEHISNLENPIIETGYELNLNRFKRQYVPVINSKGEKEVWINFFCNELPDGYFGELNWKTELVQVEDGGNCFFNIKINLTTKTYYNLEINYNA